MGIIVITVSKGLGADGAGQDAAHGIVSVADRFRSAVLGLEPVQGIISIGIGDVFLIIDNLGIGTFMNRWTK